jgi:hypothetical protein
VRSYEGLAHAEIWQLGTHSLDDLSRHELRFSRIAQRLMSNYAGLNKTATAIMKRAVWRSEPDSI